LVIALPDRNNGTVKAITQSCDANPILPTDPQPEDISSVKDTFTSVGTAYAIPVDETNIRCAYCNRIQFKGNTVCTHCKAKLKKPE
jgi:hypothetical protein